MKKASLCSLLAMVLLSYALLGATAYAESTAGGYYYQQLNGFEREVYHFILSGEKATGSYSFRTAEDLSDYSEDQLNSLVHDAGCACDMENPEQTAWFSCAQFESYDESTGTVSISISAYDCYDAERMHLVSEVLDQIAEEADPNWDRYTKAKYIASTVSSAMVYFDDVYIYQSSEVQNYEKQHVVGVLNGTAVCEGYSELFVAIANRIGLPCVEVCSKGHSFVHIQMEDGLWYGQDGQYELQLLGSSMYQGVYYESGLENIYELYDGAFAYLVQPRRAEDDYIYSESEPEVETVDVPELVATLYTGDPEFLYTPNADGVSCSISGYKGSQKGDLVIPENIGGLRVTEIGDGAFAFCRFFDGRLLIPDSVTAIGVSAFTHCSGFTGDLCLPEQLKTIGDGAFSGCGGLNGRIIYPSGLEVVGDGAFSDCSGLTAGLDLPDSILSLGSSAFYHCSSLEGILHLPDSLETWNARIVSSGPIIRGFDVSESNKHYSAEAGILYSADKTILYQCPAGYTGEVIIPEGTVSIYDLAFYECNGVSSIQFPSTLKQIGFMAFCDMYELSQENLLFPPGIESVGGRAFRNDWFTGTLFYPAIDNVEREAFIQTLFDTIIIPQGVSELPAFCFDSCVNAYTIVIPPSVLSFGDHCFDYYAPIDFFIQEGSPAETYINEHNQNGNYTIHYLESDHWSDILKLPAFTLPENTIRIESKAFAETGARVIIIPEACQFIADDAFDNCEDLVYIVNYSDVSFSVPAGVYVVKA